MKVMDVYETRPDFPLSLTLGSAKGRLPCSAAVLVASVELEPRSTGPALPDNSHSTTTAHPPRAPAGGEEEVAGPLC